MLKSVEGNFDNPEVNKLLTKHFIELRAASPEGSAHVLDIPGLKVSSIKCLDRFDLNFFSFGISEEFRAIKIFVLIKFWVFVLLILIYA